MKHILILLLTCLLTLFNYLAAQPDTTITSPPVDTVAPAAAEPQALGVIGDPEVRGRESDHFMLSLADRAKLAVSAFRGMPAGFFRFRYNGQRFDNPVTGIWNYHWIPYYQSGAWQRRFGGVQENISPTALAGKKPQTRIIFSQDYIVNLNLLDIDFMQPLGQRSFLHLSGGNTTGDGSNLRTLSLEEVNPYRVRGFIGLSPNWSIDANYWQFRTRYHIPREQNPATADRFKEVGHRSWIRLAGALSPRDSLIFTPGYISIKDKLTEGNVITRRIHYRIAESALEYRRQIGAQRFSLYSRGRWYKNEAERGWENVSESDFEIAGGLSRPTGSFNFRIETGGYYHSAAEWQGQGKAELSLNVSDNWRIGGALLQSSRAVPLLWRSITDSAYSAANGDRQIVDRSASAFLQGELGGRLGFRLEPFFTRVENYPVFKGDSIWQIQTFENPGIRFVSRLKTGPFWIENDFSYNHRYKSSFAAQVNNITSIKTSISLFSNALKADVIFNWRYLGEYRRISLERRLYQYRLTDNIGGPVYTGDLRLQTQFRDATVFFIWENLRSSQYIIVEPTFETLLIFRLGVDWVLFN